MNNKKDILKVLKEHNENGELTEVIEILKNSKIGPLNNRVVKQLKEWGLTSKEYSKVIEKYNELTTNFFAIKCVSYIDLNDNQCKFLAHIFANPKVIKGDYYFLEDEDENYILKEDAHEQIKDNLDYYISNLGYDTFGFYEVNEDKVYKEITESRKFEEEERRFYEELDSKGND